MIYIGSHVSVSDGYLAMAEKTTGFGGDTFAFFLRNPRGGNLKALDPSDIPAMNEYLSSHDFGPLVAHAPYTMNLCAVREDVREKANRMLEEDLARMELLPGNFYNFHPGSHVGQGTEAAVKVIADALNRVITESMSTTVLLETMAGKGSEVGGTFEELRAILDLIRIPEKVGVCFDTCHTWDGGYDNVGDFDSVLSEFDRIIGLDKLCAVHLNDSKNPRDSHKDRHECLGKGTLGYDALHRIVTHPALAGKPFILETPNDDAGYTAEIAWVRKQF